MARVVWSVTAESFLLSTPPSLAEELFEAVERMATAGRGFVRRMSEDPPVWGLNVAHHLVIFTIDDSGTLRVESVRPRVNR